MGQNWRKNWGPDLRGTRNIQKKWWGLKKKIENMKDAGYDSYKSETFIQSKFWKCKQEDALIPI